MWFIPKSKSNKSNLTVNHVDTLLFNGHVIQRVPFVKYLGLFIDDKLDWCKHIDYLIERVSSLTGALYRSKTSSSVM